MHPCGSCGLSKNRESRAAKPIGNFANNFGLSSITMVTIVTQSRQLNKIRTIIMTEINVETIFKFGFNSSCGTQSLMIVGFFPYKCIQNWPKVAYTAVHRFTD